MYVIIIIIIDQLTENVQIRREKKIKGERERQRQITKTLTTSNLFV